MFEVWRGWGNFLRSLRRRSCSGVTCLVCNLPGVSTKSISRMFSICMGSHGPMIKSGSILKTFSGAPGNREAVENSQLPEDSNHVLACHLDLVTCVVPYVYSYRSSLIRWNRICLLDCPLSRPYPCIHGPERRHKPRESWPVGPIPCKNHSVLRFADGNNLPCSPEPSSFVFSDVKSVSFVTFWGCLVHFR
jgi:hypothetical protein